jgi:hypothetical protein
MTALIVMLPLIVVVEISLQLHRSFPFVSDWYMDFKLWIWTNMLMFRLCIDVCAGLRRSCTAVVACTGFFELSATVAGRILQDTGINSGQCNKPIMSMNRSHWRRIYHQS